MPMDREAAKKYSKPAKGRFGQIFEMMLERRNMTNEEFSRLSGVDRTTLSKALHHRPPTIKTIHLIVESGQLSESEADALYLSAGYAPPSWVIPALARSMQKAGYEIGRKESE